MYRLSLVVASGGCSSYIVWASHSGGFSHCGACALGLVDFLTFDNKDFFVFDKAQKVKILKYLLSKSLELCALWSTFRDMCLLCF